MHKQLLLAIVLSAILFAQPISNLYAIGGRYIVNSANSDQGVIGIRTAKSLADTCGSDPCTLVFENTQGSPGTTYTFSTSLTIPSNITVQVEKGAILSVAASKTLTMYTPEAGDYQIFSLGKGTLAGLKEARPEWFGVTGSSDQIAINHAIVATKDVHGQVLLSARNYNIDSNIEYYTGTNLIGASTDISSGSLSSTITSTYNGYAIVPASTSAGYSARFERFKLVLDSTGRKEMGGVNLDNFSNCDVKDVDIFLNSGSSTNAGIYIGRTDSKGGYYHRIERVMVAAAASYHFNYGLLMGGNSGANQNVIDSMSAHRCVTSVCLTGAHNTVTNLNSEGAVSYHVYLKDGTGYGNHYIHAYMDGDATSTGVFNNAPIGCTIVAPHYAGLGKNFVGVDNCTIISGSVKTAGLAAKYGKKIEPFDALKYGVVRIVVTDDIGFTISNPINGSYSGLALTFVILNDSGGAMGTITWGSDFKLGGAFTNPASGRYRLITFRRFGSYWLEESRTGSDI